MKSRLLNRKAAFRRSLLRWYDRNARVLPWRDDPDPYVVWVSEIALQQTRVDQGTPYILRFLEAFPTVEALAAAPLDDVLKIWEGLGYYSRARNLHKAARVVVDKWPEEWPESAEAWRCLPGIGRYTAGAIASIAFGEKTPAVDGNVMRVLARVTRLTRSIDDSKTIEDLWVLAGRLVQGKSPGAFNQAMMELGAKVCKPKNPDCEVCPVQKHCAAYEFGMQHRLPKRKPKKKVPHHEIVVAAICKNGRYLLGQRPPKGLLGGLWEFPGGKVEAGETHERALRREIREELGIGVRIGGLVASVNHAYSHFKVTLNVYKCAHTSGTPLANAHTQLKWVLPRDFNRYAFPKANHKFLKLL